MSHVGARSWLMSKGMGQGGWSHVRAMESREEKRLAGVSHGHTPFPCPHALSMTILSPQQTSKSDKLKTKQDTLSKTQGREVWFLVAGGKNNRTRGHLCRPVFVRTVFLDSANTNCCHRAGSSPVPGLLHAGLQLTSPKTPKYQR